MPVTTEKLPAQPTPEKQLELGRWDVEVFYDGQCGLCRREIELLRWLDRRRRIRFTDFASAEFDPRLVDISYERLMAEIHGRLPDGRIIVGVEVFRRLYSAVGLAWPMAVTRLPGISHTLDWGYRLFARNRLWLTGRCTAEGSCRVKQ